MTHSPEENVETLRLAIHAPAVFDRAVECFKQVVKLQPNRPDGWENLGLACFRTGQLNAPIVIGRDHLDSGSVASPNRETEGMKDGSDAVADWPVLNALLNTAGGASWVSFHHGGGVGMGYSLHAGVVIVADGSPRAEKQLERVLTNDPGTGVMRHADAGYERAIQVAGERGLDLPMLNR